MNPNRTTSLSSSLPRRIFCAGAILLAISCTAASEAAAAGDLNGSISYLEGRTSDARGRNATLIEGTGRLTTNVAEFSPDGESLALALRTLKNGALYVQDADGGNRVRVTSRGETISAAHWTEDGSRLIYFSDRDADEGGEIYSVRPDGTDTVLLAENATDLHQERSNGFDPIESPSFSVEANRIAYSSDSSAGAGEAEIFVMDLDGANRLQLTNDDRDDLQPVLSPDGTRVLFTELVDFDDARIMSINADGSNQVPLTEPGRYSTSPMFTPDGMKIAFNEDGAIVTANPDGSERDEVLPRKQAGYLVGISPDSSRLVFDEPSPASGEDIYLRSVSVALDGGSARRLPGQFADWQSLSSPTPTPKLALSLRPARTDAAFLPQVGVKCSNECDVRLRVSGRLGGTAVRSRARDHLIGGYDGRVSVIGEKDFRRRYRGSEGTLRVRVTATDDFGQVVRSSVRLKVRR